jgi:transcriptional regulator with XRE-family HTH domain
MDPKARLGRRLRGLREDRGLSQEELAHAAGISRNFIGMLERGERTATVETVESVCRALGVSPGSLFEPEKRGRIGPEERLGHLVTSLAKGSSAADLARFERLVRAFFARK